MGTHERHQMVVKKTYETGAEEWFCPTCGRHMILQWPPNYKRIILDPGDEACIHSGGTGGIVIGDSQVEPSSQAEIPADGADDQSDLDDSYLSPFSDWLNEQDL